MRKSLLGSSAALAALVLAGAGVVQPSPTGRTVDAWRPGVDVSSTPQRDRSPTSVTSTVDKAIRQHLALTRAQRRYPKTRTGSHKQNRRRLLAGR